MKQYFYKIWDFSIGFIFSFFVWFFSFTIRLHVGEKYLSPSTLIDYKCSGGGFGPPCFPPGAFEGLHLLDISFGFAFTVSVLASVLALILNRKIWLSRHWIVYGFVVWPTLIILMGIFKMAPFFWF